MTFRTDLVAALQAIGADFQEIDDIIGNLSSLTTTDKTNLVAAINEIKAAGGGGGAAINDSTTGTGTTWSSSKINTELGTKQAGDSDLTAIAGLTPTNNDLIQRIAGAWINRTPAQVKTSLALTKSDVGLSNVDNTADTAKPVSTTQQAALDGKQDLDGDLTAIAGLTPTNNDVVQRKSGAWTNRTPAQLKTDLALTKTDVGLANVDNTSDVNKPISAATQAALDLKMDGGTISTQRLLGRTTAGSGAVEQLTLGTGLAFSGSSVVATGSTVDFADFATNEYKRRRLDEDDESRKAAAMEIMIDRYLNGSEIIENFTSLTSIAANGWAMKSGGAMVATGQFKGTVLKSFPLAPGKTMRAGMLAWRTSTLLGTGLSIGLDVGAANHTPGAIGSPVSGDKRLGISWSSIGSVGSFREQSGVSAWDANIDFEPAREWNAVPAAKTDYPYLLCVEAGPETISFTVRNLDPSSTYEKGFGSLVIDRARWDAVYPTQTAVNIVMEANQSSSSGSAYMVKAFAVEHLGPTRNLAMRAATDDLVSHAVLTTPSNAKFGASLGTGALASEPWAYEIPKGYDPVKGCPLVVFAHQSATGDWDELWQSTESSRTVPVTRALSAAGYALLGGNDQIDSWGAPASLARYTEMYRQITTHYNITDVFLMGASMGGGICLNLIMHDFPTPSGVVTFGGLVNYEDVWWEVIKGGSREPSFLTAFGMTSNSDSEFFTKTDGYRPEQYLGYVSTHGGPTGKTQGFKFRGVPMFFHGSSADTTVDKADNYDLIKPVILPYTAEVGDDFISSGNHGNPGYYIVPSTVDFMNRYRKTKRTAVQAVIQRALQRQIDANNFVIRAPDGTVDPTLLPDQTVLLEY